MGRKDAGLPRNEYDRLIMSGIPQFYFVDATDEAEVGSYSRFAFKFYSENGSGDCHLNHDNSF